MEVPGPPMIVVEERLHDRPVELVVTARVTVPVKPFWGIAVIVELPATPALLVTAGGSAARVNAGRFVT